jgi:predicted DCC family thiol-disulfide oxidoreductase YuxK
MSQATQLVLFDGDCGVCHASVIWLLRHDPAGRFSYAPLQGETAAALRADGTEIPDSVRTFVLVDHGHVHLRSRALFAVCSHLGWPWRWLRHLRWVPAILTDLAYRGFASLRGLISAALGLSSDACALLAPEERTRFLP